MDTGAQPDHTPNQLRKCMEPLRQVGLDVLCCQSIRRSVDSCEDTSHQLCQSLGMTYSCFAAYRNQPQKKTRGKGALNGLSIHTGAEVWMLNSGSFPLPDGREAKEKVAQFAVVRKNNTSFLVLNLQLARSAKNQIQQLRFLFSQPLLKGRYGAVIICSDRQAIVNSRELQSITNLSPYRAHPTQTLSSPNKGMLWLLTARDQAKVAITVHNSSILTLLQTRPRTHAPEPALTMEFEVNRIPKNGKVRPNLPLSFREQWIGYRDNYRPFAA
jgi:hypothetical protein